MACDVQTLINDAKCFMAMPQFVLEATQNQLLCDISEAVDGGVGLSFLSGHGDPNGVVTGLIQGQTYLDLDTNELWSFGGTIGANTGWV